jgi:hypothetical protein
MANLYSVESLLVGKTYNSKTLTGEIISAEKHPQAIWYEGAEAYLVEIRVPYSIRTAYRTIAVKTTD